jgi:anthranilate/para-aminobenzoate synthase component I
MLHSAKPDEVEHVSYLYVAPSHVLVLHEPAGIESFLKELEGQRTSGRWVAGFFGYEAGYALVGVGDPPRAVTPAAWFGVYEGAWRFDHVTGEVERLGAPVGLEVATDLGEMPHSASAVPRGTGQSEPPALGGFGLDEPTYRKKLAQIDAYLSAGDTYQVNFTDRFEAQFGGDLLGFYRTLIAGQPVPYAADVP